MGICFLEKNCHRISEISFLPSLKAKLLFTVCDGIPCSQLIRVIPKWLFKEPQQKTATKKNHKANSQNAAGSKDKVF